MGRPKRNREKKNRPHLRNEGEGGSLPGEEDLRYTVRVIADHLWWNSVAVSQGMVKVEEHLGENKRFVRDLKLVAVKKTELPKPDPGTHNFLHRHLLD